MKDAALANEELDRRWRLVLQHRDRAVRVARARCANPQDAEDCVQEGMARVVGMADLDPERVGPLLSVVVANVAVDNYRHGERSRRLRDKAGRTVLPAASHEDDVCDAGEARWLHAQLDKLPPRERDVVALRAQGRTAAETAAQLGITYKAAEGAFTRGRAALKALWRTTLVVIAAVFGRPSRSADRTAPLATPIALVAAVAALAVLHLPEAAPDRPSAGPGPAALTPAATAPTPSRPIPAAGPAADPPAVPAAAPTVPAAADVAAQPPRPAPPGSQVAVLPPVEAGPVRRDETTVVRERQDETVAETVVACVENGVTVSVEEVACR